ncbi:MAG: pro-sigmaK processing inhibitor BofA family protein [Thermoanaerobacteraceae bacterium]|nr:pro-sigmaK processing inhibitor BofA family protein [Thermoanaerobacteraceae bacterium]
MIETGILSFIMGIIVLAFLVWLFGISLKILFRFIINSIIGFAFLLIFNFFGAIIGIHLPITILTSFIVGVFGIPGILILIILKYVFCII